ncbi:MAG: hypothetical protein M1155_01320, partial [Patescibacteria group bacterium]|nr:hypothetical protein [Patescibacteria group bacterium]
ALLVLVIGGSLIYIFNNRSQNLDVVLSAPDSAMMGVPVDFKVEFSNQLNSVIKNVSLIITLPDGAVFAGGDQQKLVDSKSLGDLGAGSLISQDYQVVFLSGAGSSGKIKAVISYYSSDGVKYEQDREQSINILNSGIDVELKTPEKVVNGQEFNVDVSYKNVSDVDFSGLQLTINYPPSFNFESSDSKPDNGNNVWILGDLRKGSEGHFTIKGSAVGPDNSQVIFKSLLQMSLDEKQYSMNLNDMSITISPSPLSLAVVLNNKPDYVATTGDTLNYVISYINNTDVPLKDAVVRARLRGELFDFSSLNTDANFNSSNDTLTWNSDNTSGLSYIAPRSAGVVSFGIKTSNNYPITRLGDKNFDLNVKIEIESPTVPDFLSASTTSTYNVADFDSKVAGKLVLSSSAYFRDAASGILNKGNMPPKVGQPTDFTIHWKLQSFATDFNNIEIRVPLKEGVVFTGIANSNFGNAPVYEASTSEIVWTISNFPANKGFVDDQAEAIFQIEATPSVSQVANYMPLLGETTMTATDAFTSDQVSAQLDQVTTALPDDLTIGQQGGVVQP